MRQRLCRDYKLLRIERGGGGGVKIITDKLPAAGGVHHFAARMHCPVMTTQNINLLLLNVALFIKKNKGFLLFFEKNSLEHNDISNLSDDMSFDKPAHVR
jgi:hypothetical protein